MVMILTGEFVTIAACIAVAATLMMLMGLGASYLARHHRAQRQTLILTLIASLLAPCPIALAIGTGTSIVTVESTPVGLPVALPSASIGPRSPGNRPAPTADGRASPRLAAAANDRPLAGPDAEPAGQTNLQALLVGAWLAGSAIGLLLVLLAIRRVRRLRRSGQPITTRRLLALADAAWRPRTRHRPGLFHADPVRIPMLVGWFAPAVFLPRDLDAELTEADLRSVFVHEFMHLEQRDHWLAVLRLVHAALFWWNPIAHLILRRVEQLSEYACDDAAAKAHGSPREYARMLRTLAEDAAWSPGMPVPALRRRRGGHPLVARVARLVKPDFTPAPAPGRWARLGLATLSLGLFGLGLIAPQPVPVSQDKPGDTAKLTVQVVRADGQPVHGIAIEIFEQNGANQVIPSRHGKTDDQGRATFAGLRAGYTLVKANAVSLRLITLTAGQHARLRIEIGPGHEVRGRVVNSRGQPVAGARIVGVLPGLAEDHRELGRTDTAGRFHFPSVTPGTQLVCRAKGHAPSPPQRLPCANGDTVPRRAVRDVVFKLQPSTSAVRVRVCGPDGRPVAHAQVLIGLPTNGGLAAAKVRAGTIGELLWTGADGIAHGFVAPGRIAIRVRAQGFVGVRRSVHVPVRATRTLAIQLARGAELSGRVLRSDGQPAAGAIVALGRGEDFLAVRSMVGLSGQFTLRGIPPGKVRLRINDNDKNWKVVDVEARTGRRRECVVVLDPSRLLRGTVVDHAGTPVPQARIRVRPDGGSEHWVRYGTTDREGRFQVGLVSPGRLRVAVTLRETPVPVVEKGAVDPERGTLQLVVPRAKVLRRQGQGR